MGRVGRVTVRSSVGVRGLPGVGDSARAGPPGRPVLSLRTQLAEEREN